MHFIDRKFKSIFSLEKILKKVLNKKNPLIVDIGGNIGQSITTYKKLSPNSIIHTIEPCNESFELNKIRTKKFKKIKYHNFALGNYNGNSYLNVNIENNRTGSSLLNFNKKSISIKNNFHPKENLHKNNTRKEYVKVKKSNDFFSKLKIVDYCKIDTGGSELNILKNISKKNFHKIKTLQVELLLDDVYMYNSQKNFLNIINILLKNNFYIYDITNVYKNLEKHRTLWIDVVFVKKNLFKKI